MLTTYELEVLLPRMIKGFSNRVGQKNSIKSPEIVNVLTCEGLTINDIQIRGIVRHIRQNHLLPCLASSPYHGYWIETDPTKLKKCIQNLRSRAKEAMLSADALAEDYFAITQMQITS